MENNFWTLVQFELKKLIKHKVTWIAFGIVFGVMLVMGVYRLVVTDEVDGVRITAQEAEMQQKAEIKKLSGRLVDDALIEELLAAMGTEQFTPYQNLYSNVLMELCGNLAGAPSVAQVKEALGFASEEELLVTARRIKLEENMEDMYLTEGEKDYWRNVLEEEEQPWTYDYHKGVWYAWVAVNTAIILIALMSAVSLANLFAEEHQKKTDQLLLCSRNGKKVLYGAKITAGILFNMVSTGLVLAATALPQLILFGTDGLRAPIQLLLPGSMCSMNFGEMLLYVYGTAMLASLLYASITMCCSELFRNNTVAVLALIVVLVLAPMMVVIPYEYRVVSQIFELNPVSILRIWGANELRLIPFFGDYLTMQEAAPVLYAAFVGFFLWLGNRAYLCYQVSGR